MDFLKKYKKKKHYEKKSWDDKSVEPLSISPFTRGKTWVMLENSEKTDVAYVKLRQMVPLLEKSIFLYFQYILSLVLFFGWICFALWLFYYFSGTIFSVLYCLIGIAIFCGGLFAWAKRQRLYLFFPHVGITKKNIKVRNPAQIYFKKIKFEDIIRTEEQVGEYGRVLLIHSDNDSQQKQQITIFLDLISKSDEKLLVKILSSRNDPNRRPTIEYV